jgi:hypothetical protein
MLGDEKAIDIGRRQALACVNKNVSIKNKYFSESILASTRFSYLFQSRAYYGIDLMLKWADDGKMLLQAQ